MTAHPGRQRVTSQASKVKATTATREEIAILLRKLTYQALSTTLRIDQEEAYRTILNQGLQITRSQNGVVTAKTAHSHHRLVCRQNNRIRHIRIWCGNQELRIALMSLQIGD